MYAKPLTQDRPRLCGAEILEPIAQPKFDLTSLVRTKRVTSEEPYHFGMLGNISAIYRITIFTPDDLIIPPGQQ